MIKAIRATNEYGIIIRRDALTTKGILYADILQAMEVDTPLDSNEGLISFGPSFGQEALDEFISRLQALGLEYVDDFIALAFDAPSWCQFRVESVEFL